LLPSTAEIKDPFCDVVSYSFALGDSILDCIVPYYETLAAKTFQHPGYDNMAYEK
jgi:hypothetical protein